MDSKRRTQLAGGLVLILVGGAFLAWQLFPGMFSWLNVEVTWPLLIIGSGVLLLFIGLLAGTPAMAVPACIVGGIGGLLYWQNATGNWESWAYVWTLIPGFVGVGIILSGLLGGQTRRALREGSGTILSSLILFAIFGFFFARDLFQGYFWPALLIVAGVIVLARTLFSSR